MAGTILVFFLLPSWIGGSISPEEGVIHDFISDVLPEAVAFAQSIRKELKRTEKTKFKKRVVKMNQNDQRYRNSKVTDMEKCGVFEEIDLGRVVLMDTIVTTANSKIHAAKLIPNWSIRDLFRSSKFPATFRTTEGRSDDNSLAIKYEWDCMEYPTLKEHPLVAEYVMMKWIYSRCQIGPAPYYLSHSFPLGDFADSVKFQLPTGCANPLNAHPNMRFLVMARLGLTLAQYSTVVSGIPSDFLWNMFYAGLELLESIHGLGLFHGDIHTGNVAFRSVETLQFMTSFKADNNGKPVPGAELVHPAMWKGGKVDITLLDFGLSEFVTSAKNREVEAANVAVLSKWEATGSPPAMRDDLFRWFEIMATLLRGKEVSKILNSSNPEKIREWKNSLNFFNRPDLQEMMDELLKLEIYEKPNYKLLKELCQKRIGPPKETPQSKLPSRNLFNNKVHP